MSTLSLCMIVRDVAPYIEKCLSSVLSQVDELCIVDTGSTDDTVAVIEDIVRMHSEIRPVAFKCLRVTPQSHPEMFIEDTKENFKKVQDAPPNNHSGQFILGDYADARNLSWALATSDYCMWIDSDDVVMGTENIPYIIATMDSKKLDSAILEYDYEQDDEGRITCKLLRARILRRELQRAIAPEPLQLRPKWTGYVHESIGPLGNAEVFQCVRINHEAHSLENKTKHRPVLRNYKVLSYRLQEMRDKKIPIPARTFFYLGNEARAFDREKALKFFQIYIDQTNWDEERCLAHVYSAQLLEADQKLADAQAHYAAASIVYGDKPEPFFGLARIAFYQQNLEECIRDHEQGRVALAQARDVLSYNPFDRHYFPALVAGPAYLQLGQYQRAKNIAIDGLKYAPKDIQLNAVLAKAEAALNRRRQTLRIVFHTSRSFERWNGRAPETTGIGGSETAAIMMARSLAALGHEVTIYCDCGDMAGKFDGVTYIHYTKFAEDHARDNRIIDVFISSRRPFTILEEKVRARLKILWMHDNNSGAALPNVNKAFFAYDYIFCVSNWHKQHFESVYRYIDKRKVIATRNGIVRERFQPNLQVLPPKKNKLIYASSPDRGLELAIDLFAKVREQVPDAELHVFYGWNTIEGIVAEFKKSGGRDMSFMLEEANRIKEKAAKVPGIILRGRINQPDLAAELMDAKVWFYPTWFEESSCIIAMESQAAACTPVTTALAALKETVHHGYVFKVDETSPGFFRSPQEIPEYQAGFVKRVVWCLTNEVERMKLALEGRKEALNNQHWEGVAQEWEDFFCTALAKAP